MRVSVAARGFIIRKQLRLLIIPTLGGNVGLGVILLPSTHRQTMLIQDKVKLLIAALIIYAFKPIGIVHSPHKQLHRRIYFVRLLIISSILCLGLFPIRLLIFFFIFLSNPIRITTAIVVTNVIIIIVIILFIVIR